MPNQPKTPIKGFRLDEETVGRLDGVARHLNGTRTDAIRVAAEAMSRLVEAMTQPIDGVALRLCPLGEGHTQHLWELSPKALSRTGGIYFCAGEPFSNGYDPADTLEQL